MTGNREMVGVEKAQEIAKIIEENASTLKKVILKTKTYSPEVAVIIGGLDTSLGIMSSCSFEGCPFGVSGPVRQHFWPSFRRGSEDLRDLRKCPEGPPSEVSGPE